VGNSIHGHHGIIEITNPKHQITNKSQIPNSNDPNLSGRANVWIFEFWSLGFVIWNFHLNSACLKQAHPFL
jgi:hypothetical protein